MSLGALLKKRRQECGMTLEELAEHIGSSKSYVWGMENGKDNNPSLMHCIQLSLALGISLNAMGAAALQERISEANKEPS